MSLAGSSADIVLHILVTALSILLFAVSFRAYRRKSNRKFLYVCGAFGLFALQEALATLGIVWRLPVLNEAAHFLTLFVLVLFFYGVVE